MFTGLIEEVGNVRKKIINTEGAIFEIDCPKLSAQIGVHDSVAVNGVCLTAVELGQQSFVAQAVHTTLEKSNLGQLEAGNKVNLELALCLGQRLGGHMVQGHVGGVAKLKEVQSLGENYNLTFFMPQNLMKYIILEGSITLNGISLTVADLGMDWVRVTIIPYTWENTNLSQVKMGGDVNVEVDILAKYIEKLVVR